MQELERKKLTQLEKEHNKIEELKREKAAKTQRELEEVSGCEYAVCLYVLLSLTVSVSVYSRTDALIHSANSTLV